MKFPIYDISDFSWIESKMKQHNVLFQNPYFALIPINKSKFLFKIRQFKFVDSNGIIYIVSGFKIHRNKGLKKFFIFTCNIELYFLKTEEKYSLDEFKTLLINRVKETQNEKLKKLVNNASSFSDILGQF